MSFEKFYEIEEKAAFKCCYNCGYNFQNAEVNMHRAYKYAEKEAEKLQAKLNVAIAGLELIAETYPPSADAHQWAKKTLYKIRDGEL